MLTEDFKEILDNYKEETRKPLKNNELAFKMRNKFTNDLKDIINSIESNFNENFTVKFSPGQGSWAVRPWAGIRSHKSSESFQNGFYIVFSFNFELKELNLALSQSFTGMKFDELSKRAIKLYNMIENAPSTFFGPNETKIKDEWKDIAILSRSYKYNELNDKVLKNDLKELINVYEELTPKYKEIIKETNNGNKDDDLTLTLEKEANICNDPDLHDGSYELVRKTVKFISNIEYSKMNTNDMDMLYLMTVGTWKCSFDCKKKRVNNSNLTSENKNELLKIMDQVNLKAIQGHYNNNSDENHSVGMFGAGFMTFKGKLSQEDAQKFLKLCIDLQYLDNDEDIFKNVEYVLINGIKGIGIATVSQILHCLKPFVFPILNGAMGKGTKIYDLLGINLTPPFNDSNYINNCKIIKNKRDTEFKFVKNYRAFDLLNFYIDNDNSSKNTWLLAPGENAKYWYEFRKNNFIAIGWGTLGNLRNYEDNKEKLFDDIEEKYPKIAQTFQMSNPNNTKKQSNNVRALWDFYKNMNIGDLVFIKRGNKKLLGVGVIISDYKFLEGSNDDFNHIREVKWLKSGNFPTSINLPTKTLTNITHNLNGGRTDPSEYYHIIADYIKFPIDDYFENPQNYYDVFDSPNGKGKTKIDINPNYTKKDFLEEVVFKEEKYDNIVDLLKYKKNIILQGPPGVGKTFIAKRLAYSIIGERNINRVKMVQFHQSYSYEDFIQGIRPTEDHFELKNGIFYKFCKDAAEDLDNDYYFIIDEINRGNISKIFGELMMLIEEDKRGKDFAIPLTYSDEEFYVPKNVHLIGMMNTADRSLAMIDYALRRRFVFIPINPVFESEENKEKFKEFLMYKKNVREDLAGKIIDNFSSLNNTIANDEDLGDGFKIGHSYFCSGDECGETWYENIIDYEVSLLLKEYWFDELEKTDTEIENLKL